MPQNGLKLPKKMSKRAQQMAHMLQNDTKPAQNDAKTMAKWSHSDTRISQKRPEITHNGPKGAQNVQKSKKMFFSRFFRTPPRENRKKNCLKIPKRIKKCV